MTEIVTLDELVGSFYTRPGLVLGPAATGYSGVLTDQIAKATQVSETEYIDAQNLARELDLLKSNNPNQFESFKIAYSSIIRDQKASIDLPYLARASWSLCISLTRDILFERELRSYLESLPSNRLTTTIDHPSVVPAGPTVPIYKLYGTIDHPEKAHGLALTESDILIRQQTWTSLLGNFMDYLKDAPLLFLGTDEVLDSVNMLISTFATMNKPSPRNLIFLKDDPVLVNPTLRALCEAFAKIQIIDADIRSLASTLEQKNPKQLSLGLRVKSEELDDALTVYDGIVCRVPTDEVTKEEFTIHHHAIVDAMFRPSSIEWSPYLLKLPVKRNDVISLKYLIKKTLTLIDSDRPNYILVRGDVCSGKTTIAKQVAVDIAVEGMVALWCKRAPREGWLSAYRRLATTLDSIQKQQKQKSRYVVFVDDPVGLQLSPSELMSCFEQRDINLVFVLIFRNTDYFNEDYNLYNPLHSPSDELQIENTLDPDEISDLSAFLVRLDITKTEGDANLILSRQNSTPNDILSKLWYLFIETRSQISASIKEEYRRLSLSESIRFVVDQAASSDAARRAYEFVSVASSHDVGLPMELLVRALRINYSEFLDLNVDGRPLWGLIYEFESNSNDTIMYQTRNDVVTRVLIDLVNQGSVGRTGQFSVLKELLLSCDGSSSVYRRFVEEILVKSRVKLERVYDFEQGLELFDAALSAMQHEDRLLEHHKGLWMQRVGKDYAGAYSQLLKATRLGIHPDQDRPEYIEHIHTSLANTVVKRIRDGDEQMDTGIDLVQKHIKLAKRPNVFNVHNAHVAANMYLELAHVDSALSESSGPLQAATEALSIVEHARQIVGPQGIRDYKIEKAFVLFIEVEERTLELFSNDELSDLAEEHFEERGSQAGFALIARRLLLNAERTNRGRDFKKTEEFLSKFITRVVAKNLEVSQQILQIKIDLNVRWWFSKVPCSMYWDGFLEDLEALIQLQSRLGEVEPLNKFYYAVGLAQVGKVDEALRLFASLRQERISAYYPWRVRTFLINDSGYPATFQGQLHKAGDRYYITLSDLKTDIPIRKKPDRISIGRTENVYVGLCMNGLSVFFDKPYDKEALKIAN